MTFAPGKNSARMVKAKVCGRGRDPGLAPTEHLFTGTIRGRRWLMLAGCCVITRYGGIAKRCTSCCSANRLNRSGAGRPFSACRESQLLLAQLTANVRPEFLHYNRNRVVAKLRAPDT